MEQANIKGIPYGVANFEQVRKENLYYVDKTMYLPLLEEASNYLFLIRPVITYSSSAPAASGKAYL